MDWIYFVHLFIDFDKRAIVRVWFISIFIYEMNCNFDVDPDIINQTNGSFIFHHFHSFFSKTKQKIISEIPKRQCQTEIWATQKDIIIIIIVVRLINVGFTVCWDAKQKENTLIHTVKQSKSEIKLMNGKWDMKSLKTQKRKHWMFQIRFK